MKWGEVSWEQWGVWEEAEKGSYARGGGGHCGGLILGSESQGAVGTGRQGIVGGHKGEPRLTS